MSVKRNFVIGIFDEKSTPRFESIVSRYASQYSLSSSHMYFAKQPIDSNEFSDDVIFFNMESENESVFEKKVNDLIGELNGLDVDYILGPDHPGKLLVTLDCGGQITVKFDNLKTLEKGTFKKIDELKILRTDFGYCKGFKPNFRPIEGNSTENFEIEPEIIYIVSDTEENLFKLRDYVTDRVMEINPDFEVEFTLFFDE